MKRRPLFLAAVAVLLLLVLPPMLVSASQTAGAGRRRAMSAVRTVEADREGSARWRPGEWAKRWLWLAVLPWVGGVYLIASYVLEDLPLSPGQQFYLVEPALWLSLALVAGLFWRLDGGEKPSILGYAVVVALLASFFHIAALMLAGAVLGFGRSPYGHTLAVMLQNGVYVLSGVVGLEMARATLVVRLGRRSALWALASVSLVLALVTVPVGRYRALAGGESLFEISGEALLPALAESLLASFFVLTGGPLAGIAYRAALESFRWFSPVLPDLTWGPAAFVGTLAPAAALVIAGGAAASSEEAEDQRKGKHLATVPYVAALLAVALLWFGTGLLGVRPSLVVGQSMVPALKTGDIVLTREVSPKEIAVGDIVRFSTGKTTIVHRVIEIYDSGSNRWLVTKGDANNHADDPITADQIEGKVVAVIPKVGWAGIYVKNLLGSITARAQGDDPNQHFWASVLRASATVHTGDFNSPPPECAGMTFDNVIRGTEGDDNITGTTGSDLILGLGGNDKIQGISGDDCIAGGPGDDDIEGDHGKDVVVGGDGDDKIRGNNHDDRLFGGSGEDDIKGGEGDDLLHGGPGDDECDGGEGSDSFVECEEAREDSVPSRTPRPSVKADPTPTATPTPTALPREATATPTATPTPRASPDEASPTPPAAEGPGDGHDGESADHGH